MNGKLINVGIADVRVSKDQDVVLRTILGSCVGICVFDKEKRIGGMAHIMLPRRKDEESNFLKYADTAIPFLIDEMKKLGSKSQDMTAKITGGASMFDTGEGSFMAEIGKRNIEVVHEVLSEYSVPVVAEDTGGTRGRTIDLYILDGRLRIKKFSEKEQFI